MIVLMLLLAMSTQRLHAQERTVVATPGAHYARSDFAELFVGSNWRDLWAAPVRVPVLDLSRFAGGLTPLRTGGRQSKTLHFTGADGRRYVFRSADKYLHRQALPPDVRGTPVGHVIQDQISMLLPAAGLLPAPIQEAAGLLQAVSTLVIMPDDPRLGEYREEYAGLVGQIEENPNEGEDDSPGFAGSRKVHDVEDFLEKLDESPQYRLNSHEYLKARLVDFLIGDTDRGGDQWKFARFPRGDGYIYRPIPRDHDFAFMVAEGLFAQIATRAYPKLLNFNGSYEALKTLTFMSLDMDRRLLADIPRAQWDSIVSELKTKWTDDVLRTSVARMPQEYQPLAATRLMQALMARRDRLHEPASAFYAMVAREAEVHGTAEAERAEIERHDDGSVDVRLYAGAAVGVVAAGANAQPAPAERRAHATPYFQRRFVPQETREIRVYMHGGDDNVRVSGASNGILVRVIGGAGDDEFEDVSTAGRNVFYTAGGDDRVTRAAHTRIDDRDYDDEPPGRPEDLKRAAQEDSVAAAARDSVGAARALENAQVGEKLTGVRARDWGTRGGLSPALGHRSGVGIVLGVKQKRTTYGFRRSPHATQMSIQALYAPETSGFGIELEANRRFENSARGISLQAHATQFESFRFFGFGNDSEDFDGNARVRRDEVALRPALSWWLPQLQLSVGPVLRYGRARFDDDTPIDVTAPLGSGDFGQAGAWAEVRVERGATQPAMRRGVILEVGGSAYPALLDVPETYGEAHALARSYISVPGLRSTFLALRVGGQKLLGEMFPVHDAARLGGRRTLRGYTSERFAGDAMVYGGAELHVPITRMTLLVRGRLGIFGLADAGRVYVDGASPGGWHTATGGGLTFATLGQVVSLTYAKGATGRLYLELGLPF